MEIHVTFVYKFKKDAFLRTITTKPQNRKKFETRENIRYVIYGD